MIITFKRYPLLWGLAGLIVAFVVSAIAASMGVRFFGSIQAFRSVLGEHRGLMSAWRACVYSVLAFIWTRFGRRRLIEHVAKDRNGGTRRSLLLRKLERMMLIIIMVIESYNLFICWEA